MNDEKDVVQEEQQSTGLMAEEAQNIESEDNNAQEEGISHIQNEETGAEEELAEGEIYERPDWFPEKFWDEKDGPNIENMAKSINHLEKKLGETAPDQYDLSEVKVDPDDAVIQAVLEFGKEKQLSNKSITGLINKVIEITGGVEEEAELDISREREKLGVNAQEIIQSNINWSRKLVSDGVFTNDDYKELEVLGGTAEGQRVMQKIRGLINGKLDIPTVAIEGDMPDKTELQAMVADPKYATDPVYRKKVEKAFEQAYGT
jgi:ribosomal protein L10